jgi:hypothetical protein
VLVILWLVRLVAGWIISLPTLSAIAATGIGNFPEGDALLLEPGGIVLAEVARLALPGLRTALPASLVLLLIALMSGLVALSALLVALSFEGRLELSEWLGRALEHLPSLTLLMGLTLVVQGILAGAIALISALTVTPLLKTSNEAVRDLASLAVVALAIGIVLAVGVLQDLARAAIVRNGGGLVSSLGLALRLIRQRPGSVALGWTLPAVCSVATVLAGAAVVGALALERPDAWRLWFAFAVHQAAIFVVVVLRASWLANALRLVDTVPLTPISLSVAPVSAGSAEPP